MNRYLLAPAIACAVVSASCSERTGTSVSCSDEATISLVKQVFADGLAEQLAASNFDPVRPKANELLAGTQVSVDAVRTASRDDKVRKVECNGDLLVSLPPSAKSLYDHNPLMQRVLQEQGIRIDPAGLRTPVEYTAQPTDDGKHLHAQVNGHAPLLQAAFQMIGTALVQHAEKASAGDARAAGPAVAASASGNSRKLIRTTGRVAAGQGNYEFFSPQDDTGYGFDPDSDIGKRILAECGADTLCELEGDVELQGGQLVTLRELRKSQPRPQ